MHRLWQPNFEREHQNQRRNHKETDERKSAHKQQSHPTAVAPVCLGRPGSHNWRAQRIQRDSEHPARGPEAKLRELLQQAS